MIARALDSALAVVVPSRECGMTRAEEVPYARTRTIAVPVTLGSRCGTDANLWGRSIEYGVLEEPWTGTPGEIYLLMKAAADCPVEATYIQIGFERGVPAAINSIAVPFVELVVGLVTNAGVTRLVGVMSREIFEVPAVLVLHVAY